MAAPVEIEDPNWHGSKQLHKECEWKRDDSTMAKLRKECGSLRLPLVGDQQLCWSDQNRALTAAVFSWKWPTIRPQSSFFASPSIFPAW